MFDRIDGLRTLVLGELGSDLQLRLNNLVLSGVKTGTSSVDDGEYASEKESFEVVGEKQWLVDQNNKPISLVEFTSIDWTLFKDVPFEFVVSEGEGFATVEQWQESHRTFWEDQGVNVTPETEVICYSFRVLEIL